MSELAHRISNSVPDQANMLLVQYGYPASQTHAELEYYIDKFIVDHGDIAAQELREIHPDRDLFEDTPAPGMRMEMQNNCSGHANCSGHSNASGHSNCSGCGGTCGHSNASGGNPPVMNAQTMISNNMMFGMLAIVTLGIFGMIIAKK